MISYIVCILFMNLLQFRWYEELKQQYKTEKEKLLETINQHLGTIDDLKNEIRELKTTKENQQQELSTQQKQIK